MMLSADFKLVRKTQKCLQRLMVTADLPIRIAIIDQLVYFIKELMLETPAEHYLP
jgi:hypothetical protein